MFPETPVAGENFTLICNVISDRPTMLSWIISDGEPVNESGIIVSQTYVDEEKSTLVLSFGYLHTSHGGLYTCNSEMNVSLAGNVSSRGILLEVESEDNISPYIIFAPYVQITIPVLLLILTTVLLLCSCSTCRECIQRDGRTSESLLSSNPQM